MRTAFTAFPIGVARSQPVGSFGAYILAVHIERPPLKGRSEALFLPASGPSAVNALVPRSARQSRPLPPIPDFSVSRGSAVGHSGQGVDRLVISLLLCRFHYYLYSHEAPLRTSSACVIHNCTQNKRESLLLLYARVPYLNIRIQISLGASRRGRPPIHRTRDGGHTY